MTSKTRAMRLEYIHIHSWKTCYQAFKNLEMLQKTFELRVSNVVSNSVKVAKMASYLTYLINEKKQLKILDRNTIKDYYTLKFVGYFRTRSIR